MRAEKLERRRIFEGPELEQTIRAEDEPRTGRCSRWLRSQAPGCPSPLGLTWSDVRLEDVGDAEIEFAWQVGLRRHWAPPQAAWLRCWSASARPCSALWSTATGLVRGTSHLLATVFRRKPSGVLEPGALHVAGIPLARSGSRAIECSP